VRSNTFTAHAGGECSHGHDPEHSAHSHASVVEVLRDCTAVLCYGMGWRAAEALSQSGVQPYGLGERCTPEGSVALFLAGELSSAKTRFCRCHQ
jgi:predicted Fe-Mo cluster-binding NifX family protein